MLTLLLSSALLVVSDCTAINKVQPKSLSDEGGKLWRSSSNKWDADIWWRSTTPKWDHDFWRRSTTAKWDRNIWWRSTTAKWDRNIWGRSTTAKWDRNIWWRSTTANWYDRTEDPLDDFYPRTSNEPDVPLLICGGSFITFVIVYILIKYSCRNSNDEVSSSQRTLHPPPRVAEHFRTQNAEIGRSQVPIPAAYINYGASINDSSNTSGVNDKPPVYDDVVLGDLSSEATKYPEVTVPETPPPGYEYRRGIMNLV